MKNDREEAVKMSEVEDAEDAGPKMCPILAVAGDRNKSDCVRDKCEWWHEGGEWCLLGDIGCSLWRLADALAGDEEDVCNDCRAAAEAAKEEVEH